MGRDSLCDCVHLFHARQKGMKQTPLRRRSSLRDAYANKCRERGIFFQKLERAEMTRRKPLKKESKRQRRRLAEYYEVRAEWLRRPENATCSICPCRGLRPMAATEVHHARGRAGGLLFDTRFFIASCRDCREWPHANARLARELGLLASAAEWNAMPKENIVA